MAQKERTYRIVFNRKACIGAAACAAVAPGFWEIKEDGKAHLVGSKTDKDGNEVLLIKESKMKDAFKLNKDAAEACPVQVIQIFDADTGEKIV